MSTHHQFCIQYSKHVSAAVPLVNYKYAAKCTALFTLTEMAAINENNTLQNSILTYLIIRTKQCMARKNSSA